MNNTNQNSDSSDSAAGTPAGTGAGTIVRDNNCLPPTFPLTSVEVKEQITAVLNQKKMVSDHLLYAHFHSFTFLFFQWLVSMFHFLSLFLDNQTLISAHFVPQRIVSHSDPFWIVFILLFMFWHWQSSSYFSIKSLNSKAWTKRVFCL